MARFTFPCLLLCAAAFLLVAADSESAYAKAAGAPIVFFPGYTLSYLNVKVTHGNIPGCPSSGSYVLGNGLNIPQNGFSYKCMIDYVNLTYTPRNPPGKIWVQRPDVKVTIPGREQGSFAQCVIPTGAGYDKFYSYFTSRGYTADTLLASCYDWRLDPLNDVIAGPSFIQNSKILVEKAFVNGGNKRVFLIAHSNGPIMALAFLNAMTQQWKDTFIEGFIPLAGNFAGQGLAAAVVIAGLNIQDFSFNLDTANVWPYLSEIYYSMPRPEVFTKPGNKVTILSVTDIKRNFTSDPADIDAMFRQAGLPYSEKHWRDYTSIAGVSTPPNVRTWSYWGTNISTAVGIVIPSFADRNPSDVIFVDGDGNQENQDNRAVKVWANTMAEGCFSYQEIPNLFHFDLPGDSYVLSQIGNIVTSRHAPICCKKGGGW